MWTNIYIFTDYIILVGVIGSLQAIMLLVVTFTKPPGFPAGQGCVTHILRPKNQQMAHTGHFLAALGPAPALTAFGGGFSIGSQLCLAN